MNKRMFFEVSALALVSLATVFLLHGYPLIPSSSLKKVTEEIPNHRKSSFPSSLKENSSIILESQKVVVAPLDHPSEQELQEFPGALVIEALEVEGPEVGQKKRMRILKTNFKYPFIRTEEVIDVSSGVLVSRAEMVANHFLVTLAEGEDPEAFLEKLGPDVLSLERVTLEAPLYRVHLKGCSLAYLTEALEEIKAKKLAAIISEPDFLTHSCMVPNDPLYHQQWGLWKYCNGVTGYDPSTLFYSGINATEAWDRRTSAASIVVALIDTGVRYTHEDLAANMWHNPAPSLGDVYGWNAVSNNGDPLDDHGHGTACAGIIGAVGDNGIGMAGIAWKVQLMACKFENAQGMATRSDAIACIDYACNHGARILNCSWGYKGVRSESELAAFTRAREKGVIAVVAAGNEGKDNDLLPEYPANYQLDNIISVGSTTAANELASFSSYGATTVHLAAPGEEIYSTWARSDHDYLTGSGGAGTSLSVPQVVGTLALMMEQFPALSYQEIIARLIATTDKIPALEGKMVGGKLNVARALGADSR